MITGLCNCNPYFQNFFKKLTCDGISNFMVQNNFFNKNHSGFRPNDSYINQLISKRHACVYVLLTLTLY